MKYSEYKREIEEWLKKMPEGKVNINDLLNTALIPSQVAIPYFKKAIVDILEYHHSSDVMFEFNGDNIKKVDLTGFAMGNPKPQKWDYKPLEEYFAKADLPKRIRLNDHTEITDVPKFIKSTLEVLRNSNKGYLYEPYFYRITRVREILEERNNSK